MNAHVVVSFVNKIRAYRFLILSLSIGLVLRIFLSPFFTYYPDFNTNQLWSLDLIRYGFGKFYSIAICDYLPTYLYVLWFFGKIYFFINTKLFFISPEYVYKLPLILADIGNAALIFLISKRYVTSKKALVISLLYNFNPAVIFVSTFWGQSETLVMFFLLASIYFLIRKNSLFSLVFIAIAQTIKPICILALPFYVVYMMSNKMKVKNIILHSMVAIILYILLFLPFNQGDNLFNFIISRNLYTAGFWQFTTLNAFNFWSFVSAVFKGTIDQVLDKQSLFSVSFENWGRIIFFVFYSFIFYSFVKGSKTNKNIIPLLLKSISLGFLTMYLFFTRMHERHIYYGLIFLLLGFSNYSKFEKILLLLSFGIFFTNLIYSYSAASIVNLNMPIWFVALLSIFYLLIFFWFLFRKRLEYPK